MTNNNLDPATAQRTATIISLSLAMGVTMYAVVVWWLYRQGTPPEQSSREFVSLLTYIWIGFLTVSAFAALWLWRNRVEPLITGNETLPAARVGELMSGYMICLALIEAPCLLGVTVYLLSGIAWPALTSLVVIWFVVLATRPQAEWFQRFRG